MPKTTVLLIVFGDRGSQAALLVINRSLRIGWFKRDGVYEAKTAEMSFY